jgi:hypothetical protein
MHKYTMAIVETFWLATGMSLTKIFIDKIE